MPEPVSSGHISLSLQRNIKLLALFNFCLDFRLYAPIAIIYFAQVTHSYALGASIFSITLVTQALFDVPTGIFADSVGRKKTMILGAVSAVLYGVSYAVGISFWILATGAFFEGLSRAFWSGNNAALLHNLLSDEGVEGDYHLYSGKLSSMFQLALAISGLLGGFLAAWSFALIMWLSVVPQLFCLVISFLVSDSKRVDRRASAVVDNLREAIREFIHNPNLRLLSVSGILNYGLGESSYEFQAAFYNTVLPVWAIGIAKTLSNAIATLSFYFGGKVIDRFGAVKTLLFGAIVGQCLDFFALLFPTGLSPFLISCTSLFYGTGNTAKGSLMQKEYTDNQRATMSSLNSFAGSLFFGAFMFATGAFADQFGPRNALLIIQFLSLPILYLLWKLVKISKSTSLKLAVK